MAVVRSLGLDVELASRPGVRAADALLDVDRLVEVAEEFVASGEDPGLLAFLAYLDTAEERERGLEVEVAEPDGSRVQLMTVHAAKGLEWDVVVVAGLTEDGVPGRQPAGRRLDQAGRDAAVPAARRPRRAAGAALGGRRRPGGRARRCSTEFRDGCRERGALEERRLAYVAVTRARNLLLCSGYWWDAGAKKKRGPSDLLSELGDAVPGRRRRDRHLGRGADRRRHQPAGRRPGVGAVAVRPAGGAPGVRPGRCRPGPRGS